MQTVMTLNTVDKVTANAIGLFISDSSDKVKRAWFYCRYSSLPLLLPLHLPQYQDECIIMPVFPLLPASFLPTSPLPPGSAMRISVTSRRSRSAPAKDWLRWAHSTTRQWCILHCTVYSRVYSILSNTLWCQSTVKYTLVQNTFTIRSCAKARYEYFTYGKEGGREGRLANG